MKIPSWLKKIWKAIQSLFSSIPSELKSAIHIGVLVTENIKNFVESPVADVLTTVIPGEIDNQIKTLLRNQLPNILIKLKLADQCANLTNPEEITICAVKCLQGLNVNIKGAFLHNLSVLIAQIASDGKLTWEDGAYVMEWYYQHHFKETK